MYYGAVGESRALSSGVVEALKEIGAFFGVTLISRASSNQGGRDKHEQAGLLVSTGISLIRALLLPHTVWTGDMGNRCTKT